MGKRACTYCGAVAKLSREHMIPRWLHSYLPPVSDTSSVVAFTNGKDGGEKIESGIAYQQTFRNVCRKCNSGWMSTLQNEVRDVVIDLVGGECQSLTTAQQLAVSRWLAMTAISVQHQGLKKGNHLKRVCSKQTYTWDPTALRSIVVGDHPPLGWTIWIGRTSEAVQRPLVSFNFPMPVPPMVPNSVASPKEIVVSGTLICLGSLLALVCGTPNWHSARWWNPSSANAKYQARLWPISERILNVPCEAVFGQQESWKLVNEFCKFWYEGHKPPPPFHRFLTNEEIVAANDAVLSCLG